MAQIRQTILILILAGVLHVFAGPQEPKFLSDDPIQAMPAPLSIKTASKHKDHLVYDLLAQTARRKPRPAKQAGAINTIGEVPDSEWFTNRHGQRRMSREELQGVRRRGANPVPPFTIISGKTDGVMSGFSMKDARGRHYFAKLDPIRNPEMATAADVIASNFLYATGYNTPHNEILNVSLSELQVSDSAKITPPDGRSRKMTRWDLEDIVDKAHRYPDGSFRIVASVAVEGENIGPFEYEGLRNDDPNDIVPHENRRELRGLYVCSAWLNNTDARSGNTLDTIVDENGRTFIRHYLIDFASALGSDGDRPKPARLGFKFATPTPTEALMKIFSLGVWVEPWERVDVSELPAVGHFESQLFEPDNWKSNYPNPAFLSRLPDDDFWAAKQVMAFTNDDIRAIVETAKYTDPRAAKYIIATLAERRDKIGRVFFSKVLPLDRFRVERGELLFDDLATNYGFSDPRGYNIRWARFDNVSRKADPISDSGSALLPREMLNAATGSYFSADIHALGDPVKSVSVYLHKGRDGFKVVGVDRTW